MLSSQNSERPYNATSKFHEPHKTQDTRATRCRYKNLAHPQEEKNPHVSANNINSNVARKRRGTEQRQAGMATFISSARASTVGVRAQLHTSTFGGRRTTTPQRAKEVGRKGSSSAKVGVQAKGEWLPGLQSPGHLNGTLPGDNGFDPLSLGEKPESLRWYVQAELVNGRWAMLGVAGMLIPDILTKIGLINVPAWYDAGKVEYFASSSTLFVVEFILFHYVEIRRWQDIKYPGSVNQDPIFKSYSLPPNEVGYPGGIFNPLNFSPTFETKQKEIANGRLAMLAFLGFVVQHNVTGKSPFDNLLQHLSDPWHNTIIQTIQGN